MKATYALLGVTAVIALGAYGWHLFMLYQTWQRDTPRPQVDRLIRDLQHYHAQANSFPLSFHQINQKLWHTQPQPDYGESGREANVKNYFYRYTQIEADKCVFWALPTGPQRDHCPAFFVVVTPSWVKEWRAQALSDERLAMLPPVPPLQLLRQFDFAEVPSRGIKRAQ